MKILFLTHTYPNYVPDLLLHGLRKLLGASVVDYPRKDCVYEGVLGLGICPREQRCPGWFPHDDKQIDRTDIWLKIERDYFDMVVCDLRALPQLTAHLETWPKQCVIIDGEDQPHCLAPGPYIICRRETDGSDYSVPLPMALPEEIFNWITQYDGVPKQYSIGFLGSTHNDHRKSLIEFLSRHYSDTLFQISEIPSHHTAVPEGRLSRDSYYRQLQQCRIVLSLAGAGCDTFRFWEHAACSAVHMAPQLPLLIPNDFKPDREILRYEGFEDLKRLIDRTLDAPDDTIKLSRQGRRKLVQHHLTTHRAVYFLDRTKKAFNI